MLMFFGGLSIKPAFVIVPGLNLDNCVPTGKTHYFLACPVRSNFLICPNVEILIISSHSSFNAEFFMYKWRKLPKT